MASYHQATGTQPEEGTAAEAAAGGTTAEAAAGGTTAEAGGTTVKEVGTTAKVTTPPDRTFHRVVDADLAQTFMAVLKSHMQPEDPTVTIRELPGRTATGVQYEMLRPMPEMLQRALGVNSVIVRESVSVAAQAVTSASVTPIPRVCDIHVKCTYKTCDTNANQTSVDAEIRVAWKNRNTSSIVRGIVVDTAMSWLHREIDYVSKCL